MLKYEESLKRSLITDDEDNIIIFEDRNFKKINEEFEKEYQLILLGLD